MFKIVFGIKEFKKLVNDYYYYYYIVGSFNIVIIIILRKVDLDRVCIYWELELNYWDNRGNVECIY